MPANWKSYIFRKIELITNICEKRKRQVEKIKVLNIVYTLKYGGVQTLAMNLFRNIDRERFQIDFLVVKPLGDEHFYDREVSSLGGNIIAVGNFNTNKIGKYISYEKGIYRAIKEGNYDVVHINSGHIHTLPELVAAKRLGVKNIITHSHNGKLTPSAKFYRLRSAIQGIYKNVAPRLATYLLTCSDLAAEWAYSQKAIESGKVIQIKNGIIPEMFRYSEEKRRAFRDRLKIGDELVLGHIGRFTVQKNHKFLIEVFSEVKKKKPDAKLVLCGDGELINDVKTQAEELGIISDIIFMGVTRDVPEVLSGIDAFVFPSLFEGLPVVGVEAQASGVPVFASDTITKDVVVTPVWHTISLTTSVSQWADEIVDGCKDNRPDTVEMIKEAGFDIRETANKIEKIYLNKA